MPIEYTGAPEGLVVPEVKRFLLIVVAGARLRVARPLRVRAVLGAELCRFVSYFAQRQELLTAHLPVLDSAVANLRTLHTETEVNGRRVGHYWNEKKMNREYM